METETVSDFERLINPARVPAWNSRGDKVTARLWVKIQYKGGRLSITGVEGPLSNGDALGSCGQCGIHAEAVPLEGFTLEALARLRAIWDEWHLNDMRPYSAEMKAAGWNAQALRPVLGYHFTRTMESYKAAEAAKGAALEAAKAGQTFTPTPAQVLALNRPYEATIWTYEGEPEPAAPEGMERARHIGGHNAGGVKAPERKTLGWIKPSEHPDGLLGRKLNPDDSKGYGGQWWREPVPLDVLQWLAALPLPPEGIRPAWA